MAEDKTPTKLAEPEPEPAANTIVTGDGSSNTVILEEGDTPGATNGAAAGPVGNQPSQPGIVVVVADQDPETGDVTLVEGKSTDGDGRVRIDGTDRVFEDQAAFEDFLAEVNAKEDAGVPFEDILGDDAGAIPVVVNGVATGQTLDNIDQVAPATGETPLVIGDLPNRNGGATDVEDEAPGFGSEPPPRNGARDPDSPLDGPVPSPSANGNAEEGPIIPDAFAGRDQDAIDRLRGREDQPVNGERQPGRDEDGNLLPGAEGRVTLDDFNRINDRDGNGINDGVENPVDLDGNAADEEPRFDPPALERVDPVAPPFEPQDPGQPFEPGGDGTPEPPNRGVDTVVDPAPPHRPAPPVHDPADDGVLLGDSVSVVRDPDDYRNPHAPDLRNPDAPAAPHNPPAVAPVAPVHPPPSETVNVHADPPASAPVEAPVAAAPRPPAATPPAQVPAYAAPPAAESVPDPIVALDTFDTGTEPTPTPPPPAFQPPAAEERVAHVAPPDPAPAQGTEVEAPAAELEDCEPGEEGLAGILAAARLSPAGAARGAADVFDSATIGAAVSTAVAGASEEGGANLLERIFDRVKDALFDSGPSDQSPVQLPVQPDAPAQDLPTDAVVNADEQLVSVAPAEAPADIDGTLDDSA